MNFIKIPFLAKSNQALPLQNVLDYTASRMRLSPYTVAIVMTHLFESIADEVCRGRTVRIPGFGVFAPCLDERPQYLARRGGPKCVPMFSTAKGFRQQVMLSAPPHPAGKKALKIHKSKLRYSNARVLRR